MRRLFSAVLAMLSASLVIHLSSLTPLSERYTASEYYLKHAFSETGSINSITAVYLYYRYYDTLFEALMLMLSIIGIMYLSANREDKGDD